MKEAKLQSKQAAVADVVDKMKRAQSVVVLDYRGLTVAEVSDLRKRLTSKAWTITSKDRRRCRLATKIRLLRQRSFASL